MKAQQKHILFLPRWYPNRYDPMWGLFVKKHAEAAALKQRISVLYLEALDKELENTEIEEYRKDGVYSLYIYYSKPKNLVAYFFVFIRLFFWGFKRINKENKIDLTHVHILSRMGLLALLARLCYGIPFVITEHWSRYLPTVNTFKGKVRIPLTRLIVKYANAIMPVTQNLSEAMKSYGLKNTNYKVVANVVDQLFFQMPIIKKEASVKRIIHVSTFEDKSKNISGIIKAISIMAQHRQDFIMVFIGDGMDFKKLKDLAEDMKIPKKCIEFTGMLENKALVNQYQKADFMLVNSHYENMPVVINEALACGLAVLSTDVGGISEHLNKERGRLILPDKPQEFLTEFEWMLEHCRQFNAQEIRDYAYEHFSFEKVGDELSKLYNETLKKTHK